MSLEDLTTGELLAKAKEMEKSSSLFNELLNDPKTRAKALALVKEKRPNMPIPELDAAAEAKELVAAERAEREKLEAKIREEAITRDIKESRERVKKQYDLTDADVLEVEKIMLDKDAPIANWDGAAKVFKASKQQATPTPSVLTDRTLDMPDKAIWAGGIGNKVMLDKIGMKEAVKAANEFRGGKAA